MDTLTALKKIRRLLSKPEKWTKGALWDDATGAACLIGAKVDAGANNFSVDALFGCNRDYACVPDFNDDPHTTHDEILMLLDNCIMDEKLRATR